VERAKQNQPTQNEPASVTEQTIKSCCKGDRKGGENRQQVQTDPSKGNHHYECDASNSRCHNERDICLMNKLLATKDLVRQAQQKIGQKIIDVNFC
jgi:hypothetical protein